MKMEHPILKLTRPKYQDTVVYDLVGVCNDEGNVYCTINSSPESFEIVMSVLNRCTGSNWYDGDTIEIAIEELTKRGIPEDTDGVYNNVLSAINEIHLYGTENACYSMFIKNVYFESKSDSVRYTVDYKDK